MKPLSVMTVLVLFAAPLSAHAVPILGEWRGTTQDTFASNGEINSGLLDVIFTNQDPDGTHVAGRFLDVCTTNTDCGTGGFVDFAGTLINNILTVPFSGGEFAGIVSGDGNTIAGHYFVADAGGTVLGDWSVTRVPEPTTISLFALGLAGIVLSRRMGRRI